MILVQFVYPYPKRRNQNRFDNIAIAIDILNAFDIMAFVDNISCIQPYSTGGLLFFFITLAVSAFQLAFPIGLIDEDEVDPRPGRTLIFLVTPIFTDIFFAIIRGHMMVYEDSLQLGFIFFFKKCSGRNMEIMFNWQNSPVTNTKYGNAIRKLCEM